MPNVIFTPTGTDVAPYTDDEIERLRASNAELAVLLQRLINAGDLQRSDLPVVKEARAVIVKAKAKK
jgi:exopolyphosphatase/pppGpp-phosphohydrolase